MGLFGAPKNRQRNIQLIRNVFKEASLKVDLMNNAQLQKTLIYAMACGIIITDEKNIELKKEDISTLSIQDLKDIIKTLPEADYDSI